ncbi:MAG: ABC transporter permease, partial [Flavisolibacter sp.]
SADGILGGQNWTNSMRARGSKNEQLINFLTVGYDFLDAMGIEMKEGRKFSKNFPADTMNYKTNFQLDQTIGSVVLNETAVKDMGITYPAVGKQIIWGTDGDTTYYLNIVGVAKDFHFTSLKNQIKPFAFVTNPSRQWNFTVKLSGTDIPGTLAMIEKEWKKFSPERPMEYNFLDETFARLYQAETRFQKVFISLVILGIIIACLGLLGLATFAAQQRVKEIGIRKVLGATVSSVVTLLSKDFLKLVLIAFLISLPVAWYAMNQWLLDFAYRIEIRWWIFPLAGLIALMVAFVTISFQAFKAAVANPVKNLRTE